MFETEYTELEMRCVGCSAKWDVPVARQVNVKTHPDARLGILLGTMHRTRCPVCKKPRDIEFIFEFYDPDQSLLLQIRPDWEIIAGGGEDWYWERYEDLVKKYAELDVRVDVVFGMNELVEKYLGGEDARAAAREEWAAREAAKAEEEQRASAERAKAAVAEPMPAAEEAEPVPTEQTEAAAVEHAETIDR
ncbi:MAG TPA: CpXC domain-containing protein [Nitrolancea sp.]|nr:CpXC domain-containing protein [Nitrolancea sp.]